MCYMCEESARVSPETTERVQAGIAYLDEAIPQWRRLVNVAKLDLDNVQDCIMGQVFAEYANNQRYKYYNWRGDYTTFYSGYDYWLYGVNHGNILRARELGFYGDHNGELTRAWKDALS